VVNVTINRDIKAGEVLTLDDVELEDSLALTAWNSILSNIT